MQFLASGGCLRDPGEPAGLIDPGMMRTIADFLFDAGILHGADRNPLRRRRDAGQWFTTACLPQEPALPSGARNIIFRVFEGRHRAATRRREVAFRTFESGDRAPNQLCASLGVSANFCLCAVRDLFHLHNWYTIIPVVK